MICVTNGDSMRYAEGLGRSCELIFESVARCSNIVSLICMVSHRTYDLHLPCYTVGFNQPYIVGRGLPVAKLGVTCRTTSRFSRTPFVVSVQGC